LMEGRAIDDGGRGWTMLTSVLSIDDWRGAIDDDGRGWTMLTSVGTQRL